MPPRKQQRLQVNTDIQAPAFRPIANPVDTFSNPQAGQQLAQLAAGLSTFSPALSRLSATLHEQSVDEQTAKGAAEARRLQEERVTYKEAVKRGLVQPHQNPWFVFGLKQQMGRVAAGDYANALNIAVQKAVAEGGLLGDTPDEAEFEAFEADFRKQWMEEHVGEQRDLHFERGFAMVDGLVQNEANKFAAAVGARYEQTAGEALSRESLQVLDTLKNGSSREEVVTQLNAIVAAHIQDNPKGGRLANRRVLEAVTTWALTEENAEVLDYLKDIKTGTGNLYGTAEARQVVMEAQQNILRKRMARYEAEGAEERRADKVAEEGLMTELIGALQGAGDPSTVDLAPFVQRMLTIDPSPQSTEMLYNLRRAYIDRGEQGDPQVFREAMLRVHGVHPERRGFLTLTQAARMAADKTITTSQFAQLASEIEQRENRSKAGQGASQLLSDDVFQVQRGNLRTKFISEFGMNNEADRIRASEADNAFVSRYIEMLPTLQAMTPPQRMKAVGELSETVYATWASQDNKDARAEVERTKPATVIPPEDRPRLRQIAAEIEQGALSMDSFNFLKKYGVTDPKGAQRFVQDNRF